MSKQQVLVSSNATSSSPMQSFMANIMLEKNISIAVSDNAMTHSSSTAIHKTTTSTKTNKELLRWKDSSCERPTSSSSSSSPTFPRRRISVDERTIEQAAEQVLADSSSSSSMKNTKSANHAIGRHHFPDYKVALSRVQQRYNTATTNCRRCCYNTSDNTSSPVRPMRRESIEC